MVDQTKVLAALCAAPGEMNLNTICQAVAPGRPFGPKSKLRIETIRMLGRLVSAKLAMRTRCERTFGAIHACWTFTAKGRELIRAGGRVKSGPKGPFNGLAKQRPGTLRERAWKALRIARKATLAELAEVARTTDDGDGDDVKVIDNLRKYLKALSRVGLVSQLPVKQQGFAPTSNGFVRYALTAAGERLGPLAPIVGKAFVIDPNARTRIPYPATENQS